MTHLCPGCAAPLNLDEDGTPPANDRAWLWLAYNARCDACWHREHTAPIATCLRCCASQPTMELAA